MSTPQLRTPPTPHPGQPSHRLIALLDEYLEAKGLIFPRSSASIESTFSDGDSSPTSQHMSLSSHHDEQDDSFARATALEPVIYQVYKSLAPSISQATLQHLDKLYSAIATPEEAKAFAPMSVTEKVTKLRLRQWERDNAVAPPPGGNFEILVITGIDCQGSPVSSAKLFLPWDASWPDVETILKWSIGDALESLGEEIVVGGWVMQWTEGGKPTKSLSHDFLACAADFEAMTSRLIFEMDAGVVVWHRQLWAVSQRLRQESKDGRVMAGSVDRSGEDALGMDNNGSEHSGGMMDEDEEELLSLAGKMLERGELRFEIDPEA